MFYTNQSVNSVTVNSLSSFLWREVKGSKALPFSETYMDKMLDIYNEM